MRKGMGRIMDRIKARNAAIKLVDQMTLEEKASQLRYNAPAIKRLNIPEYNWWNEALHGVARAGVATSFPQAIALAATFDLEAVQEVAECIAEEGRAKYNAYAKLEDRDIYKGLTFWSPNVNIFRDPRWGRGHETYGEDPYLTSKLGVAYIRGLQGNGEFLKAAACVKHYAVHSGPESIRHEFNAVVNNKDLRETYLPAFEACVKEAKVEAVMGAYNRTNGEACCASETLINTILRKEWKFEGHFVSDCWAIRDLHEHHMITTCAEESAALALKTGCDLNCGNTYLYLIKAYQDGLISEEEITQSTVRLFTTRYLLGLFEETAFDVIPFEKVECKEHIELAEKMACKASVLLKNDGILPLAIEETTQNCFMKDEKITSIGVIGPNANSRKALMGNYYGTSSKYVTVLEGIQEIVPDSVRVFYSEGCHINQNKVENLANNQDRLSEAQIVAQNSDVIVLCLGLDESLEGEEGDAGNQYASGDKEDIQLPYVQRELIESIMQYGKPVIACILSGSALDLSYLDLNANAILQAWYPGARGGTSIAKLPFGKEAPSGKLPITFLRTLEGLLEFFYYSMKVRTYRYLKQEQ